MTGEERSATARARAEKALVRLAHELGEEAHALIVLGGLGPEVLAREAGGVIPDHLGTTDVDVLLITRLGPDADLGPVEVALERIEFGPDPRRTDGAGAAPSTAPLWESSSCAISTTSARERSSVQLAVVVSPRSTYVAPATSPATSRSKSYVVSSPTKPTCSHAWPARPRIPRPRAHDELLHRVARQTLRCLRWLERPVDENLRVEFVEITPERARDQVIARTRVCRRHVARSIRTRRMGYSRHGSGLSNTRLWPRPTSVTSTPGPPARARVASTIAEWPTASWAFGRDIHGSVA